MKELLTLLQGFGCSVGHFSTPVQGRVSNVAQSGQKSEDNSGELIARKNESTIGLKHSQMRFCLQIQLVRIHVFISLSYISGTPPKENGQIQRVRRKPLGGGLGVNLTLYI